MLDKFYKYILNKNVFFGMTIVAFWIKFNIVFFTYKPFTATKFFFPIYALFIAAHIYENLKRGMWKDYRFKVLCAFILIALIPIGYLNHPHDWTIYKQWSLSLVSFLSLYLSATFIITHSYRKYILSLVYLFCIIAALYCLGQYYLDWSYSVGHLRRTFALERPFGILDDPGHSSGLYIIGLYISAGGLFYKKQYVLLLPLVVIFFISIIKSFSAGAILALLGSGIILLIGLPLIFIKQLQLKRILWLTCMFWGSAFLAMILFFHSYNNNFFKIATIINSFKHKNTIIYRLDLMLLARNIILKNPLFGTGLGNDMNPAIYSLYHSNDMVFNQPYHIRTTLLSTASTIGLLGTLLLIGLCIYSIYEFSKIFIEQKTISGRFFVLLLFCTFLAIQIQSYSLLMLYSISFWFSLILPFTLKFLSPQKKQISND